MERNWGGWSGYGWSQDGWDWNAKGHEKGKGKEEKGKSADKGQEKGKGKEEKGKSAEKGQQEKGKGKGEEPATDGTAAGKGHEKGKGKEEKGKSADKGQEKGKGKEEKGKSAEKGQQEKGKGKGEEPATTAGKSQEKGKRKEKGKSAEKGQEKGKGKEPATTGTTAGKSQEKGTGKEKGKSAAEKGHEEGKGKEEGKSAGKSQEKGKGKGKGKSSEKGQEKAANEGKEKGKGTGKDKGDEKTFGLVTAEGMRQLFSGGSTPGNAGQTKRALHDAAGKGGSKGKTVPSENDEISKKSPRRSDTTDTWATDTPDEMQDAPAQGPGFVFPGNPNAARKLTDEQRLEIEALQRPEDIDLQERKRLNEGLRRRMKNPQGLRKGLVEQWQAATSATDKFTFLKAYLLDRDMSAIQIEPLSESKNTEKFQELPLCEIRIKHGHLPGGEQFIKDLLANQKGKEHPQTSDPEWRLYKVFVSVDLDRL
ncbi:nipblb [Symbiodinium sp. CCMP2592]|nr:nipblb [Symbiodinium sp. CCMP2592]